MELDARGVEEEVFLIARIVDGAATEFDFALPAADVGRDVNHMGRGTMLDGDMPEIIGSGLIKGSIEDKDQFVGDLWVIRAGFYRCKKVLSELTVFDGIGLPFEKREPALISVFNVDEWECIGPRLRATLRDSLVSEGGAGGAC